jgi:site-specific recombinase XerD
MLTLAFIHFKIRNMEAKTTKKKYNTILSQAKKGVPGFTLAYGKFIEKTTLEQSSKGLIVNYSRSLAYIALHFGRVPHQISVEEINAYLYSMMVHEKCSLTYFKHAVFALRYWFRLFGMEDKAIQMPPVKKEKKLPVVLSRQECKELFKAPQNLKHRFLLAFAYAGGLRMNELRLIKISDVDLQRRQVHIRHGKGRKQRCVTLSKLLTDKLPQYISKVRPTLYLFEGLTPAQPMGQRSIQYIISEALTKTSIQKQVSMHTLRHSFATHLLEDGVDIHTIQHLLGHADLIQTLVYLHVAQVKNKPAHSPLDTLYNIISL